MPGYGVKYFTNRHVHANFWTSSSKTEVPLDRSILLRDFIYTVRQANPEWCLKYPQNFNTEATWSCNMSYERKFCGLSEYVQFQKVKLIIKSTDWSKQDLVDLGYADLKSNI